MERIIEGRTYDEERALFGSNGLLVKNCRFDGPADGESAFKESKHVEARDCFYNLRYPFWHNEHLIITGGEMTNLCRAALWYVGDARITGLKMHGIKALRECHDIKIDSCDIISPEFGWSVNNISMRESSAESEYFMMRSDHIEMEGVKLTGKYSFQYVNTAILENCEFNTKDAFWHSKNVTVKNSVINGEYLGWYSDHLTLDHCKIVGTQPLCYCTNLTLISCEMIDCDLAFERSDVKATITTPVTSIKNPYSGSIRVPGVGEIIMDDEKAEGKITITT